MIFDDSWNEVLEPDLEQGRIVERSLEYMLSWIIDTPATLERRVVAEYPNGGKDIATVEVSPEIGHWVATLENGDTLPFIPYVPDGADKSQPIVVTSIYESYEPYSEEELESRRLKAEEELAKAQREAKNEALLLSLEAWQEERADETQTLGEVLLALGEVGEIAATAQAQEEVVQSLMLAVAELGSLVATLLPEAGTIPEMEEEQWQTSTTD